MVPDPGRRSPGRPRDKGVGPRALAATQDLLVEVGFDRLSIEGVAELAGVSRPAIYRRWSGRTDLVLAAVADAITPPGIPDTGDLREDLLTCGMAYVQHEDRGHRVLAALLAAVPRHEDLRRAASAVIADPYLATFVQVLERAVARGLVDADLDLELAARTFPALAFERTAAHGVPVDEAFVTRVVDGLLLPALMMPLQCGTES